MSQTKRRIDEHEIANGPQCKCCGLPACDCMRFAVEALRSPAVSIEDLIIDRILTEMRRQEMAESDLDIPGELRI